MQNKPFLFVESSNTESFLQNIDNSQYSNKIVFLEGTGEICHNGKIYGKNETYTMDPSAFSSADDYAALHEAVISDKLIKIGNNPIVVDNMLSNQIIVSVPSMKLESTGISNNVITYTFNSDGTVTSSTKQSNIQVTGDGNKLLTNRGTYSNVKSVGNEPVLGSGNIVITPQDAFTTNGVELSVNGHSGYQWIGRKTENVKKILWLGTSIPSGDEGSTNNYPTMVGEMLGVKVYNNAKAGSFMFCYPVSNNITDSMANWDTADNVDKYGFVQGYSLTQTHAEVETMFRNKLNQLRRSGGRNQAWVDNHIANFKAHSYESLVLPYIDGTIDTCDTVIIDHGFNDRDNIFNICGTHRNDAADNYSYWPADQVGGATVSYPVTDGNVGWDWLTHLSDSRSYAGIEWMNALRYLAKNNNGGERTHYFGAMAWLIDKIWKVNPRIKIIIGNYFAQNYSMSLDGMATFRTKFLLEANEQIAKFYGLQCVNVYKYTGLRGWAMPNSDGVEVEDIVLFCPDGVHPHSDTTGASNRAIAQIYARELGIW